MNKNTEALLDKIRKLRAKAEDSSTTEEESLLFSSKVAELLQAHGFHESALDTTDEDDDIVSEVWNGDYLTDEWRRHVCNAVAKLYFCSGYSQPKSSASGKATRAHVFVGRAHNVIVAREMSSYLIETTLRLGKQWRKQHSTVHHDFVMFLRACGNRITERVLELHRAQTTAAPVRSASGNPANLPALYEDEATRVREFLKKLGLTNLKNRQGTAGPGAHAGRAAGDTVSLSTQVSGRSAGKLLS